MPLNTCWLKAENEEKFHNSAWWWLKACIQITKGMVSPKEEQHFGMATATAKTRIQSKIYEVIWRVLCTHNVMYPEHFFKEEGGNNVRKMFLFYFYLVSIVILKVEKVLTLIILISFFTTQEPSILTGCLCFLHPLCAGAWDKAHWSQAIFFGNAFKVIQARKHKQTPKLPRYQWH